MKSSRLFAFVSIKRRHWIATHFYQFRWYLFHSSTLWYLKYYDKEKRVQQRTKTKFVVFSIRFNSMYLTTSLTTRIYSSTTSLCRCSSGIDIYDANFKLMSVCRMINFKPPIVNTDCARIRKWNIFFFAIASKLTSCNDIKAFPGNWVTESFTRSRNESIVRNFCVKFV